MSQKFKSIHSCQEFFGDENSFPKILTFLVFGIPSFFILFEIHSKTQPSDLNLYNFKMR